MLWLNFKLVVVLFSCHDQLKCLVGWEIVTLQQLWLQAVDIS